jgi:Zn-dependent protease with chaperone function
MKKILSCAAMVLLASMSQQNVQAQLTPTQVASTQIVGNDTSQIVSELVDALQHTSNMSSITGFMLANEQNMPSLYQIVKNLTVKLNNPMPLVLVFKGNILWNLAEQLGLDYKCNAFAISLTKSLSIVCVGQDLVEGLKYDELEATIAHELCHIDNYHTLKSLVLFMVLFKILKPILDKYFPTVIRIRNQHHCASGIGYAIEYIVLTTIIFSLIKLYYNRVCEKQADLGAARIIKNPISLADSLDHIEKIYANKKHCFVDFFIELGSTHPLTKNRRQNLEAYAQAAKAS